MGEGHEIGAFVVLSPTLPPVNQSNAMTNKRVFNFYLSRILVGEVFSQTWFVCIYLSAEIVAPQP